MSTIERRWLTPFSRDYWRACAGEFTSLRSLSVAALMIALHVVLGFINIPVGESLRVKFVYLADMMCMLLCGPLVGIPAAIASDLLSFAVYPTGAFFPGYTLSCVVEFLICGLILYRRPVTVLRLFLSRMLVNLISHVLLGSLWSAMLMGKAYLYYAGKSILKNLFLLPFEVMLLCLLLGLLLPILTQLRLIPHQKRLFIFRPKEAREP